MFNELTFYNRDGEPIAYTEDNMHIYLFNGSSVAYLDYDSVYSYTGKHLGFFQDGCIWDHKGQCVFFTERASSGPLKPIKKIKPVKGIKKVKPIKSVKQVKPVSPIRSSSWSPLSSQEGFFQ